MFEFHVCSLLQAPSIQKNEPLPAQHQQGCPIDVRLQNHPNSQMTLQTLPSTTRTYQAGGDGGGGGDPDGGGSSSFVCRKI